MLFTLYKNYSLIEACNAIKFYNRKVLYIYQIKAYTEHIDVY